MLSPLPWITVLAGAVLAAEPPTVQPGNAPCSTAASFDVRNFGARGDGRADDSPAFQAALDAAARAGGKVQVPPGIYVVANLRVGSCTEIQGTGDRSVLRAKTGPTEAGRAAYALSVNAGRGGTPNPADNVRNVTLRSFRVEGTVAQDGFSEHKHLVNLNAVTGVLVEDISFVGFRGDGLYLGSGNAAGLERHNRNVVVRKCRFDGVNGENRNGISIVDGDGVLVEANSFTRCSRKGMPGPIDLEPNPDAGPYAVLRDITIRSNRFDACGGNAAVGAYTRPLRLARRLRGLRIASNEILATNRFGVAAIWIATGEDLRDPHPSMDVDIAANRIAVDAPIQSIRLTNVIGAQLRVNIIRGGGPTWLGDPGQAALSLQGCAVRQNSFADAGGSEGALILGSVRSIEITSNRFVRSKPGEAVVIGLVGRGTTTTSEGLTIRDNTIVAVSDQTWRIATAAHRTDQSTLRIERNVVEGGGRLRNELER